MSDVAYRRQRVREGRLPYSTKFYQAIGGIPDSLKNWAFNTFLLLFYNQILGLPASQVSLVLTLAIVIDAVTDPMVGSFSDGLKTKWGRRHPLMYAAILPLGTCLYFVFSPPAGLEGGGLLAWLAVFTIGARVAMTFFIIPWNALFAEFSDNYAERSLILTWRYLVGGLGTIVFTMLVWTYLFPSTDAYPQGQLNPEGYGLFAPVLALSVMVAAFLTTRLTMREVPYLLQPTEQQKFGVTKTVSDLVDALKNRDFMILFVGVTLASLLGGTHDAMDIYMNTYFWGLVSEDLRWFGIAAIGGVVGFILIPILQARYDKRDILVVCMVLLLIDGIGIIVLRFADLLPDNGDPMLLMILLGNTVFRVILAVIVGIMFTSMIADTLDVQELETGKRQEGVFSAALSFSGKAVTGLGILAAGLLLDFVIEFPRGVAVEAVADDTVLRMGYVNIGVAIIYVIPFYLVTKYSISRLKHAEVLEALYERRKEHHEPVRAEEL